ncbi:hypothetical protein CDO52_22415 [Nocardiopsis gilva YIM 90087]|uniref:Prevent-host-death family protein n=1 Tax=Nocardiopsis gilva YIM 90087 TaxID=1235441 RepID=A0A223SAY4_9ACTN|nr:hypothetical protein [Nocardiopsis gilva]ASU85179.1 hypothetical protein CDO52_22415 [Nocardiopsis gilva YIM 90087]
MSGLPIEEVSEYLTEIVKVPEVVYITGVNGHRLAAIVPLDVAAVGESVIEALEDAADIAAAQAAREEPGERIPADQLWAELGV